MHVKMINYSQLIVLSGLELITGDRYTWLELITGDRYTWLDQTHVHIASKGHYVRKLL